jgi:Na+-driven multidrug efflux pump
LIFPLFMGIDGIMYAGPVADALAAIVCTVMVKKEYKNLK